MIKNILWNLWARGKEVAECFVLLTLMIGGLMVVLVVGVLAILFMNSEYEGKPVSWCQCDTPPGQEG